jgi:hypothetical protein
MIFITMIKQNWNISGDEKVRILNIHEKATKNLYLINEQTTSKFEYSIERNDGFNEQTTGKTLYFVKNGDTFDVWYETPNGEILSSGAKLPTIDELGIIFNKSEKRFTPNKSAQLGRKIARTINTNQGMNDKGIDGLPIVVMFTDSDGIPKKARLQYTLYPLDTLKGQEIPLEDSSEIKGDDYFVYQKPNKEDKYGKGLTTFINDKEIAEKV